MTQHFDIGPAPRKLTSLVRSRAWTEPRVRFWLLAACILAGVGIWFILSGVRTRIHERWLIEHGVRAQATVLEADGETVKGKMEPPGSSAELRFSWHGAEFMPPRQGLPGRKEYITVGATVPIRVNPDNPNDWTPLDEPQPLLRHCVGGLMILPIALLALICGSFRRRQLLQVWREGIAEEALVVETRFTATAPLSRAARVTPAQEGDQRIFTVYIPHRLSNLTRGDALQIVRKSEQSSRAVAVGWFEEKS